MHSNNLSLNNFCCKQLDNWIHACCHTNLKIPLFKKLSSLAKNLNQDPEHKRQKLRNNIQICGHVFLYTMAHVFNQLLGS